MSQSSDVEVEVEPDKALNAVRIFCRKARAGQGAKRTHGEHKGWYEHDWGDLVQLISFVDYGHIQPLPKAWAVGNQIKKGLRGVTTWDERPATRLVHQQILADIRLAVASLEGKST